MSWNIWYKSPKTNWIFCYTFPNYKQHKCWRNWPGLLLQDLQRSFPVLVFPHHLPSDIRLEPQSKIKGVSKEGWKEPGVSGNHTGGPTGYIWGNPAELQSWWGCPSPLCTRHTHGKPNPFGAGAKDGEAWRKMTNLEKLSMNITKTR